jgi:Abnormal spindle-like microcephaly-assoc'd, ASPM-SPD-2-Hydin
MVLASLSLLTACQGFGAGGAGTAKNSAASIGSSPASLAFGSVTVGQNQSIPTTLTNNGGSSVTLSQIGISGTGFTLNGLATPLTLAAGQSTNFSVKFAPTSSGFANGNVTVNSDASNAAFTIPISGTGTTTVGQLSVSPGTLPLGTVVDGSSATASGSLSATGANVTVSGATTNNSVFSVGGLSLPVTIAAGQSVPFSITFSPQTPGSASASLTVTSSAQPSIATATLTGTGTAAPSHTVNLSWNASTSPSVSGYNVYRALYTGSCGSYSKVNSVLNTTTLYSDSSVSDGVSYCYAATAVNTSSQESGYSNIVNDLQVPLS